MTTKKYLKTNLKLPKSYPKNIWNRFNHAPHFPIPTDKNMGLCQNTQKYNKLDKVGPIDNRLSTDKLNSFVQPTKKVTCDT